jgi:hypothetical protein
MEIFVSFPIGEILFPFIAIPITKIEQILNIQMGTFSFHH